MKLLLTALFIGLLVVTTFAYAFPQYHWWNTLEERQQAYCKTYKPSLNNTQVNGYWGNRCYYEQWPYYCKIRAPADCPTKQ